MEIQYSVTLSVEKSTYYFLATNGQKNSDSLILNDCGEQPDQDFLTFMQ
jgi:hypothetical protein